MKESVAVLGGGTWGATLGDLLARQGHDVAIWEFFPKAAEELEKTRTLRVLPALKLHESVRVTHDLAGALKGRRAVVSAVPSAATRSTFRSIREKTCWPARAWSVSVTKGIENDTLKRMSEIMEEELPEIKGRVAVLSGPSHAEEVAEGIPTCVVSAGPGDLAERSQKLFTTDAFRVYTGNDFVGVELGGALKNIYAIACGVCDGLGLGDNTKAALMTRGLNEMIRIGIASGARGLTFFGLSGMGDLIVTCGSRHSRNRLFGEKIGQGKTTKEALAEMTMVAEGVMTTKSGHQLAQRHKVHTPIIDELYACLFDGKPAKKALHDLLTRPATTEMMHVEHLFNKGAS